MSIKVKICGITSAVDGLMAVEAGADLLGFVFHEPSPRYVSVPTAADIIAQLPPAVVKVGVFVNSPAALVSEAIARCGLNILQFHGDEPPDYCWQFGLMTMKAFRVSSPDSLARLADYPTDAWLLDSATADQPGGTGQVFNWDLAIAAQRFGRLIFLAGGLTPENVAEAVRRVRPFGVDVSTGVEAAPGKKDPAKVRAFVQAARAAEQA